MGHLHFLPRRARFTLVLVPGVLHFNLPPEVTDNLCPVLVHFDLQSPMFATFNMSNPTVRNDYSMGGVPSRIVSRSLTQTEKKYVLRRQEPAALHIINRPLQHFWPQPDHTPQCLYLCSERMQEPCSLHPAGRMFWQTVITLSIQKLFIGAGWVAQTDI